MEKMTEEEMEKKRNLWIIPTDKPSRLIFDKEENRLLPLQEEDFWMLHQDLIENQQIYITSDEEIKEGDWLFDLDIKRVVIADNLKVLTSQAIGCWYYKKIILTTDQDLIKDGVQSIDDEFLQWFVKNPSCEEVEVLYDYFQVDQNNPVFRGSTALVKQHKIIIPKEEPKQLTNLEIAIKLEEIEREEVREVKRTDLYNSILSIVKQIPRENVESDAMDAPSCAYEIEQLFYKWQQERMYSEEDMKSFADWVRNGLLNIEYSVDKLDKHLEQWKKLYNKYF